MEVEDVDDDAGESLVIGDATLHVVEGNSTVDRSLGWGFRNSGV